MRRAASCRSMRCTYDGGGVVDEGLLLHGTPDDELVGQVLAEAGDAALIDVGRRVDAPGARKTAQRVGTMLGSLAASMRKVAR